MLRLNRLTLTDFRNYTALTWRPAARIAVLYGQNGSGKTNLLEALSLLVPGRGLRNARNADLPRQTGPHEAGPHEAGPHEAVPHQPEPGGWAVAARLQTADGEITIGTGCESGSDRRVFRLDGAAPRNQADIARLVAAVWLTPQMDRLFQEGLSGRRRFLDRLVWALEPGHAREMAAHDTAVHSRNRLLSEGRHDRAWLAGLEDSIARHAVAASAARLGLVTRLNAQIEAAAGAFPPARIGLACPIAERLETEPALAAEDWLRAGLATNRPRDAAAGSSALGAHRTDMLLTDLTTGTPAGLASTGQQKALLIGVVLAHAGLIASARGFAPLLLLDEPAVHLDADRRQALFSVLAALPAQTVITGTDAETFLPLAADAEAFAVRDGQLHRDGRFLRPENEAGPVPQPR